MTIHGKGSESTRARILAAASRLVRERGAGALTLEAAAREAGVSKGGLLHHFSSKQALIAAMVEDLGARMLDEVDTFKVQYEDRPGALTRAIIAHTERSMGRNDRLPVALIAALTTNPELLEPARRMMAERFTSLRTDGIPFEIAAIANLAADGMWFMELLGIEPFGSDDRALVLQSLRELVDGAS